jgi:hypothetical protein
MAFGAEIAQQTIDAARSDATRQNTTSVCAAGTRCKPAGGRLLLTEGTKLLKSNECELWRQINRHQRVAVHTAAFIAHDYSDSAAAHRPRTGGYYGCINLSAAPDSAPPTTQGMPIWSCPMALATTQPTASAVWPAMPHHWVLRDEAGPFAFS